MAEALIEFKKVSKSFPGVQALRDVDFALYPGEVVALCGANGAGKSTAASIIAGVYPHDSGELLVNGAPVRFSNPKDAEKCGVGIVYQEPTLVQRMSVVENIFLGKELLTKLGTLDFKLMKRRAEETLATLGFGLDVNRRVSSLTLVEREATEIAKAVLLHPRILILDEVTAPLHQREVEHLFKVVRNLKKQNIGMIFVSHKLNECIEISDRIVVFRNGHNAADLDSSEGTTEKSIIVPMLGIDAEGDDLHDVVKSEAAEGHNDDILRVEGYSDDKNYFDVDFTLHKGEILGFAGLKGAGITELFFSLQGTYPNTRGSMYVKGGEVSPRTPYEGINAGIGMVTNDRHKEGLALLLDVKCNITISSLKKLLTRLRLVRESRLRENSASYIDRLEIKTPSLYQMVANLSGGNQQKIVIAKWLMRDLDVIIADEPTRGVDIKAKSEIFKLLSELRDEGKGVIVFSPECRELLSICDRILIVADGRITSEVSRGGSGFNEPALLEIIHSA